MINAQNAFSGKRRIWLSLGTGLLASCLLIFGTGDAVRSEPVRWMTVAMLLAALLVCLTMLKRSLLAYSAFSHAGKRRLDRRIAAEGTARYVKLSAGGKGLDVGCGSGALTVACAKRNPEAQMLGIDHWEKHEAGCRLCHQTAAEEHVRNVAFQVGNMRGLDFPDESFDAVTSNDAYHKALGADRQTLLLETLRVLKKGGVFAIHDRMSHSQYGDMEAFRRKLLEMGYESVEIFDTTSGMFMPRKEVKRLMPRGSTLLVGRK